MDICTERIARRLRPLVLCVVATLAAGRLAAHPNGDELLRLLNEQIQEDPENAELYLQRGNFLRRDAMWGAALADLERAAELTPDANTLQAIELAKAELFLDAGWPKAAETHVRRLLARQPDHPRGLLIMARSLARLGQGGAAAQYYTRAITLVPVPNPDYHLERARAWVAAGEDDEALRSLEEGLEHFGSLTSLHQAALRLEIKLQDYEAALARLQTMADQTARREEWLIRRGELLEQLGRTTEARATFEVAGASLAARPRGKRATAAMSRLQLRLQQALERLSSGSPTAGGGDWPIE